MNAELVDLIHAIRRDESLFIVNEETTKLCVVLPLLVRLGWDRDNPLEVAPEYAVGTGRVDFCLKQNEEAAVFLEVKRLGEPLDDHQQQLLRYAFERGVSLAALTDGVRWWLYLPTQPGSWEQRRFFTIDLKQQEPDDAATQLRRFLEKSAVFSGTALSAAQELHNSRKKERQVREALPSAWRELCDDPDSELIELLSAKVEGCCGHNPDPEIVAEFIVRSSGQVKSLPTRPMSNKEQKTKATRRVAGQSERIGGYGWTFGRAVSFTFGGKTCPVRRFKDILLQLAVMFHERNPEEFWIRTKTLRSTRGKAYYTREPENLQEPFEIGSSGIWVETCFSANDIRRRCHELLATFDHPADDLSVEVQSR
jgi:predicted type IV restriction endonuclease